jgi:hypothetical protein
MANPADSTVQNLLPVQAYFDLQGNFQTFIGQNKPFYATISPYQSGLHITNSTIDSTTIGATTPSTAIFTNMQTNTGQVLTAPVSNTDLVNKLYADSLSLGVSFKNPVICATTAPITLSGLQTIDTISVTAGQRVLVKNQSNAAYNGIYNASASAWTRSSDCATYDSLVSALVFVIEGGQAGTAWYCYSQPPGTIDVTPINWSNFSVSAIYYAGTGLTLTGTTFSITPVGTAGTYGSASNVPVITTNASGQVSSVTNTPIAIANTQVSGLGTMSTQNASSVNISGGTIDGTTIGGVSPAAITGTTITANTQFVGPGTGLTGTATSLNIGGNAATATSAGSATSVSNSVTFDNSGTGNASGTTFNGSAAKTISYNTIGAPSATGGGASGTWSISVTGNAGTVTNGLYSTGSYSNPTWLTSILGSIVSGPVASATTTTNISGGTTGALPYQTALGTTSFLSLGTTNYVLTAGASAPQYVAQSTLSVGSATTATTATNLAGGGAGYVPYQSGSGTTSFLSAGTIGQVLTSNGTSAPTWTTPAGSVTVSDDTTTNATRYILFSSVTSGSITTEYVSSTKLQYNPSTGAFTASSFNGAGTGLTGTASSLSIGGNAATATSATTATNLAGGANGSVPYQTGSGATTFLAAGTNGYVMTLAGGVPTWAAAAGGITITDDTTTNATRYPLFAATTSGSVSTEYTSSTKYNYTPSTGELVAPVHNSTNGFIVNGTTASSSYTIGSGFNAFSVGPVTIASGVTITVSAGQRWVII